MGEVGEGLEKVWEAGQDGYDFGKEHLGPVADAWGDAAAAHNPEGAQQAAEAWDRGDHMEAIGHFVGDSFGALADGASGFVDGLTGNVAAEAPSIDLPSTEDVSMGPETQVAYDDPPPPPAE